MTRYGMYNVHIILLRPRRICLCLYIVLLCIGHIGLELGTNYGEVLITRVIYRYGYFKARKSQRWTVYNVYYCHFQMNTTSSLLEMKSANK